jgi:glutamate racemase
MIGVFDSGYGGLTILKAFIKKLPEYDYIYLGDSARTPYGNKSQETIYKYTEQAVDFLFKKGCRLVIIACNTASAKALRKIQKNYLPRRYPGRRVLGVIIPAVEHISQSVHSRQEKPKTIALIGTRSTIESGAYGKEIKKADRTAKLYGYACPLLVPLVEENWLKFPETDQILRRYLAPIQRKNPDYLILGCTHYPFLYGKILKITRNKIKVINPPAIVAGSLKNYLRRHQEIEKILSKQKKVILYTTDEKEKFEIFAVKYLKSRKILVKKAKLE